MLPSAFLCPYVLVRIQVIAICVEVLIVYVVHGSFELGHHKLHSKFPSTAHMPDGLPPEIFITVHISIIMNFTQQCANSKVRSCVPGHTDACSLMFQHTIFIAVLVS